MHQRQVTAAGPAPVAAIARRIRTAYGAASERHIKRADI
jgi:hypothetical protein